MTGLGILKQRWLGPADVVERLRLRWKTGEFLKDLALGQVWEPISVGLRTPTAAELAGQFGAVQDWRDGWQQALGPGMRLEWLRVGGRVVGVNELPGRVWIEDRDTLWRLLGVRSDVVRFTRLAELTRQRRPDLQSWVADQPMKALVYESVWANLLGVVNWIAANAAPTTYLRQIDVPNVDTKFVEKHQAILAELLDRILPPNRIDGAFPRSAFAGRYRLARKPSYVRLRRLDGRPLLGGSTGPAELGMRIDDLVECPIVGARVFIIENDVSYLALPSRPDAIAIVGEGYAVSRLVPLRWLAQRELVYWGDLDTHGFVVLDRLRATFPAARSMLMDRATLLDHEGHWVREDVPTNVVLDRLTPEEAALYQDLVEGRYGDRLRLEQERVRFGVIPAAMA